MRCGVALQGKARQGKAGQGEETHLARKDEKMEGMPCHPMSVCESVCESEGQGFSPEVPSVLESSPTKR